MIVQENIKKLEEIFNFTLEQFKIEFESEIKPKLDEFKKDNASLILKWIDRLESIYKEQLKDPSICFCFEELKPDITVRTKMFEEIRNEMKKQISSVFISQESHRTYKDPAFFVSSNFEFPKAKFDNQISNVIAKLKVIKEWFQTKVETKNSIFIVTRQKDEKEIPVFNWILNPKSQKLKEAIGILSDLYLILTQSKNEFSIPSLSKASSPSIRTARSVAPPPPPPPPGLNAPPPPPPAPGLNAPPPPPPPKKTEDKKNSALELIKQRKKANELKKQQALKEQESQTKNECDRISLVRVKPQLKEYTEDIRKQAEEEYKNDNQTQKVSIIDLFALAEDN